MSESAYKVRVTLTNEDRGYQFADFTDAIDEFDLDDNGRPDFGDIYRTAQREYGRCQSSVYIDTAEGPPRRIGWFFVSRQQYEDSRDTYLRGAWIVVERVAQPAQPAQLEAVEVGPARL